MLVAVTIFSFLRLSAGSSTLSLAVFVDSTIFLCCDYSVLLRKNLRNKIKDLGSKIFRSFSTQVPGPPLGTVAREKLAVTDGVQVLEGAYIE